MFLVDWSLDFVKRRHGLCCDEVGALPERYLGGLVLGVLLPSACAPVWSTNCGFRFRLGFLLEFQLGRGRGYRDLVLCYHERT